MAVPLPQQSRDSIMTMSGRLRPRRSAAAGIVHEEQVMALDPKSAAIALHRFGLGPRPGAIAAIASDPRGALLAELEQPRAGQIDDPSLLSSGAANRAV